MPKETFYHLSEKKQQRIMDAAKKEFSRVPLGEASIAQIIKDADIPRGSFYQYFEDKEDLYFYYFQSMRRNFQLELNSAIEQADGKLFEGFELYFSKMIKEVLQGTNAAFYKNLFMSMDYRSFHKVAPHFGKRPHGACPPDQQHKENLQEFYDLVDLSLLEVANQQELKLLVRMLMHTVFSTIAEGYKQMKEKDDYSIEEVMAEFKLKLNWLKYGATKKPANE
ncbi:TetR family transcriptional regulator [Enterococcus florum]|uniref:TetR family transcriptional regulator n=1 Tax=Enterococcus florum TaxID=2480627 RepID=A0A4P5PCS3_9ENTE|nr:TetR/AcrR family transcriptional regulator [Enterococcus florum]GCF95656.1 TetR family transcriptional regulator [Enterococcus florum]